MIRKLILSAAALAALGIYVGCNSGVSETSGPAESPPAAAGDHHDKPGAHGGTIASLGADNYHVEAVFEKGGILRLFVLGKDESRVQQGERQEIKAHVKREGEDESTPLVLKPEPQDGDAEAKTSQFVGLLPKPFRGKRVVVTFAISIGGERFKPSGSGGT